MKCFVVSAALVFSALMAIAVSAQPPQDAVWIDVRTPTEYAQGHLPQAELIPFDSIGVGVAKMGLAKDAPIYLYCAVGGRAEKAKQSLQALGYSNVTNAGGLADARALAEDASPCLLSQGASACAAGT